MSAPQWVRERASPWVVAIIIGFALMLIANVVFVYVAVSGEDRVVPSYRIEPR